MPITFNSGANYLDLHIEEILNKSDTINNNVAEPFESHTSKRLFSFGKNTTKSDKPSKTNAFSFGKSLGKEILILANTIGFFGVVENNEYRIDLTNTGVFNKSYIPLDIILSNLNNKVWIVGDTDTINYYKVIIKTVADAYNTKVNYNFVEIDDFIKKFKLNLPDDKKDHVYVNILEALKSRNMKYDYILMNPPYDGSLHLKIVEKAIELLKDDNSICVNLSPVRWLQDPLAKYKKGSDWNTYEESILKCLCDYKYISLFDMQELFGKVDVDAAIYVFRKSGTYDYSVFGSSIYDKIYKKDSFVKDYIDFDKLDGVRVRINPILAHGKSSTRRESESVIKGQYEFLHYALSFVYVDGYSPTNGKFWSKNRMPGAGNKVCEEGIPIPQSIRFDNLEKAINFENSTKTTFYRYVTFILKKGGSNNYVPYLGDVENPRTHKMGYESDWTNEDLCKVFGITGYKSDDEGEPGSEWETILETMKPYLENKNEKD